MVDGTCPVENAKAGESIEAVPVAAFRSIGILPVFRLVAKKGGQALGEVFPGYRALESLAVMMDGGTGPLGRDSCVHQKVGPDWEGERLKAQPFQQFGAVRSFQNILESILGTKWPKTCRDGQKVDVVVSGDHSVGVFGGPAEDPQRVGSAVNQIAQEEDFIFSRAIVDALAQGGKLTRTTVYIADDPSGHSSDVSINLPVAVEGVCPSVGQGTGDADPGVSPRDREYGP